MIGHDGVLRRTAARVPRDTRVWGLAALLAATAGLLHATLLAGLPQAGHAPHVPWLLLVAGFVVAEVLVVHVRVGRESVSFSSAEVLLVLGLFLSTPTETVTATVVGGALVLAFRSRQPMQKLLFNAANTWLGAVLSVVVWRALADVADPHSLRSALAAVLAGVTIELTSAVCTTAVIAVHSGEPPRRPVGLGTGVLVASANGCFALVALAVLRADWRDTWAVLVLAAFLAFAQRAHLAQVRRNDALEDLQGFARRIGSNDLQLDALVHEVLTGVRELLRADTAVLDLAGSGRAWCGDEAGVRELADRPARPLPSTGRRGRRACSTTVPLAGESGPVGSLTVSDALPTLRQAEQRLLEAAAGHVVMALQNAALSERLHAQVAANERQALHDALTGLPNRVLFDRTAARALSAGEAVAVLLFDLDRFKEVNDTLGHSSGDAVLREVGARLADLQSDAACVARLGGDEFAVVLAGGGVDEAAARTAAHRIGEALARPLELDGVPLSVDASIGIALAPHHGADAATLLRSADIAMYAAKGEQAGVAVYDPSHDHHSAERLSLVADLRRGIAEGQLRLAYQPKTTTVGRHVPGVEALVRWQHPVRGLVPPDQFIEVAERTGLITPLTDWVLGEALAQCRRWRDAGLDLGVAVNISPRTLRDPGFADRLLALLDTTGVPAGQVTLEITESALMTHPEHTIALLRELREHGLRLSVDDLGVGHSSMAYLKRLPVDEIKVDRSFVTRLADDPADRAIVAALVQLVHRLGMSVVAEGVEDEASFAVLAGFGTDVAQGYWMSRPLPAAEVAGWVQGWQQAPRLPGPRQEPGAVRRTVEDDRTLQVLPEVPR